MSNANVVLTGQRQLSGDEQALFRDIFTGEVITAYLESLKLSDKIRVRTIVGGKSASFGAMGRVGAGYHVPGTELLGQDVEFNDRLITVDGLLVSDVFIADIYEAMQSYEVRGPLSTEMGHALSLFEDRNTSRLLVLAARSGEILTGDGGGTQLTNNAFANDGAVLAKALFDAKQAMEEKNVPVDTTTVYSAFLPAQWYLLAQAEKVQNNQYNGGESPFKTGKFSSIAGVEVIKSNALCFGRDDTPYNASTNADGTVGNPNAPYNKEPVLPTKYHGDFTKTKGVIWTDAAAGRVELLGMSMDMGYDIRRQGTLMVAKKANGGGVLRGKCSVELKIA